jgi:hypothetical protein
MHRPSIAAAFCVTMLLLGFGLSARPARAGFVVTLEQVGSDVVASGSGAIDLTDLSPPFFNIGFFSHLIPNDGVINTGQVSSIDEYSGITGPTSFGSAGDEVASSGSGDLVGISGLEDDLVVPAGYISGEALSDSATYDNRTLASLGVIPGTYTWTWGSGPTADSFTLDIIAPAAVPEPSSLLLLAGGLIGLVMLLGVRSRSTDGENREASAGTVAGSLVAARKGGLGAAGAGAAGYGRGRRGWVGRDEAWRFWSASIDADNRRSFLGLRPRCCQLRTRLMTAAPRFCRDIAASFATARSAPPR